MSSIPESMLKDWIVEDLQDVFNKFDDNRYSIFEDLQKLDHIADNIKLLKENAKN